MSNKRFHERREHPRVPAHSLAFLSAQLSGGAPVALIDVSHRGVRLETTRHMRPGQTVCIRFTIDRTTISVNAGVVRAAVTTLEADAVRYETALSLSDDCTELQVALVERRRETRFDLRDLPTGERPRQGEPNAPDTGRSWWLAGGAPAQRRPASRA